MRNLLEFLSKYNYWLLFFILEFVGIFLVFRYNTYQQSVFFTSANTTAAKVYEMHSGVRSYLHLREENKALLDRNIYLEEKLRKYIKEDLAKEDAKVDYNSIKDVDSKIDIIAASVVKNSVNLPNNFITIDKGWDDGVRPEMGVVNAKGVVGIVYKTSPHYASVISVLSSMSNINCKISRTNYFGYLDWQVGDDRIAYLKDLPRHAEIHLGDTIVTSGYSSIFPMGVMVGTVEDMRDSKDGLSYLLTVSLATDFGKLGNVRVISLKDKKELTELSIR